jgi:DNA-binding protein YbaB
MSDYNYPHPDEFINVNGKGRQLHYIITVRGFKELLMMMTTDKAKQVRKYYIDLEEIVRLYDAYNMYFMQNCISKLDALLIASNAAREESNKNYQNLMENNEKILRKLDETSEEFSEYREDAEAQHEVVNGKLDSITKKFNISVLDRVVQPENYEKKEYFIIYSLRSKDYTHKVIRTKFQSLQKRIDDLLQKNADAKEIYCLDAVPNAKTLYQNVRDELNHIKYKGNYIKLPADYSEDEFLADVDRIYNSRKEV